jgi:hypothetical protein
MIQENNQGIIEEKLSEISLVTREQLIKNWRLAHKQSPPKGISRRLLEYSAAYQLQVKTFGGLKPTVRRKLRQATRRTNKSVPANIAEKISESLSPGTRLLREWHGHTHTVEVIDCGFLHEGETYKSLSHVARVITGTRWSGPRFFGL